VADYAPVATYFKLERPFYITQTYTDAFLDPAVKMP
jgi:hypothetical protein